MRISRKPGSVYEVLSSDNSEVVGCLVVIARDDSQLGSDVVAVYGQASPQPSSEPLFFVHVFLSSGVNAGIWRPCVDRVSIQTLELPLFVTSADYGACMPGDKGKWFGWRVGQDFREINRWSTAELGLVVSPDSVRARIREGFYDLVHPEPPFPVGGLSQPLKKASS